MFTNDNTIAKKLKMISNHGQEKRYFHKVIGCNSRLDAIQAGVLNVKLKYLDKYCEERAKVAKRYDLAFREISDLEIPERNSNSTHVFHQYTLKVLNGKRDELIVHLKAIGVPSMIYYPVPLYKQEAFRPFTDVENLPVTESLCKTVMSLPIHSEMKDSDLEYIIQSVKSFPHFG
jgi:dTDP-4-amino-4,6-dideoxygalactose transaminase